MRTTEAKVWTKTLLENILLSLSYMLLVKYGQKCLRQLNNAILLGRVLLTECGGKG